MTCWIARQIVLDLESGNLRIMFTLVDDPQQATRFSSSEVNRYIEGLRARAEKFTWEGVAADNQNIIKVTGDTMPTFAPPEKDDDLWVGHPNGAKSTLP